MALGIDIKSLEIAEVGFEERERERERERDWMI